MDKYKIVAQKIQKTYENNLSSLDLKFQDHFAQRMYRITGSKKFIEPIVSYYRYFNPILENYIDSLEDKNKLLAEASKLYDKMPIGDEKGRQRKKAFQNNEEYLVYSDLLLGLRNWERLSIKKERRKQAVDILKKIDLKKYFINKGLVKAFSTQLIDNLYKIEFLRIANFKDDFWQVFKNIFLDVDDRSLSDLGFHNKLYSLTHYIISASDYYQEWVDKKEFGWILDYFKKNIEGIIKRTNVDIVAEIGICFLLCQENDEVFLNKIKDILLQEYQGDLGYIPRGEKKDLGISEHTNVLVIMLFLGIDEIYKGPNLSNIDFN